MQQPIHHLSLYLVAIICPHPTAAPPYTCMIYYLLACSRDELNLNTISFVYCSYFYITNKFQCVVTCIFSICMEMRKDFDKAMLWSKQVTNVHHCVSDISLKVREWINTEDTCKYYIINIIFLINTIILEFVFFLHRKRVSRWSLLYFILQR